MALTTSEKRNLDTLIRASFETIIAMESFRNKDIAMLVGMPTLSPASIQSSLNRVLEGSIYSLDNIGSYGNSPCRYKIASYEAVICNRTHVKKERNLLYFDVKEGSNPVIFDFITKTFNVNIDNVKNNDYLKAFVADKMYDYEWIFNYSDNLYDIEAIIEDRNNIGVKTMPKGFAKYIADENITSLCYTDFANFILLTKYGEFGINLVNKDSYYKSSVINLLDILGKDTLQKIVVNSAKKGLLSFDFRSMSNCIDILISMNYDVKSVIDINRDFNYNLNTLFKLKDKEKNEALAKKLQKLNFINGLTFDNYVVVVPQTQDDKVAEGKMQNNCVGSYYDESILEGRNLIYFIRKIDSPTKSYMTCRYNIANKDTVEYRLKNNCSVRDKADIDLVKAITEIIRKGLAK